MTDFPILRDFGFILTAAAAVGLLARFARVPHIVAYIVAGLLLGPVTGLVHETESLELVAEVGIALLLFLVGLELSLAKIRDVGKVALLAGGAQIFVTALLGYGLSVALGFEALEASLLALALTFSSTVVVVKLLERRGELNTMHGRIAVGILLVQDLAVAVSLTLLAGMGARESIDVATIGRGLLQASAGMAALVVVAWLGVRFVLPTLFTWIRGSLEALFVWSLTWCFGFIVAAHALGLSVEIGAFVAGIGLAQLPYNHELVRRVNPLVNFFLAVFFVTLGVRMAVGEGLAHWPSVLALSAFALLVKPAILMALIPRFGYGERTSFMAALTLGQISEFSLIIAALAFSTGLIDDTLLSVIGLVGLVTIGTSAAMIQVSDRIHSRLRGSWLLRLSGASLQPEPPTAARPTGHIIIVGMNSLGRQLVRSFSELGEWVLAIDIDADKLRDLPCASLQGSTEHPAVLEEANLAEARLLVSALQIEDANNLLAWRAREAGVPCSIHAFDPALADELRANGATHLMVSKYDGIRQVAAALRNAGVIT
ncbi:MAG TPA: cation:proton antiporter [Longimicrobiales bacterium]|nr:cation:proton antiporter [Longimicrobiales bacterium]